MPEHDLLAQAVLGVAAVQAVGDAAPSGCCLDRGVEQVQRDPADLRPASTHRDGVAGDVDVDLHAGVGVSASAVRVEAGEALLLAAVGVEALAEVALGVQQADRRRAARRDRDAALRWSPASTPRPPLYCGSVSLMPNSGEK